MKCCFNKECKYYTKDHYTCDNSGGDYCGQFRFLNARTHRLCVSSSVLPFREKAEKVWELGRYKWPRDIFTPVVFFGMYHIGDYFHFMRHLGKKAIVWCGSDIQNLQRHGKHKWLIKMLNCADNYCENRLERNELRDLGIEAEIRPTFLEDVYEFPICYPVKKKPIVYISAREGREREYGVDTIVRIAEKLPEIEFRIYGIDITSDYSGFLGRQSNVKIMGNVSPKKFNGDIRYYHCGLRLNKHDGFSEITAKSVLMGQYPITRIQYPLIDRYETEEELISLLKKLTKKTKPNYKARDYWQTHVNDLPFLNKKK